MTTAPKAGAASKTAQKSAKPKPFQLPPPIAERLRRVCDAAGIDPSDFIASIIGEWIEDETIADLLVEGWKITDHGTIAEIYRAASGSAPIVPFPNAKPRLIESSPPEPVLTHGINIHLSDDDLSAWNRATKDGLRLHASFLKTLRTAAALPVTRKMRWNALPPGTRHQIPIMFTEADDKAFKAQAQACGVPVEIWAIKTLIAAWRVKGGQA